MGTEAGTLDGLESACTTVDRCIDHRRENADLHYRLTENGKLPVSGFGDRYYATRAIPEFFGHRRKPIPDELNQQINQMRSHFAMGLFPEISRAWVTVDCDIYMWNYEENSDLAYFDGIRNTVMKIALARPKKGVFQPHVHYLLVVGTTAEIILLAVSFTSSAGGLGDIALIPEPLYTIDLENAVVGDIATTHDGRIFFSANETLFELEYFDKGWFKRYCKKVNRTTNLLESIVPFLASPAEEIESLALDDTRHVLFALTKKGSIHVYDLGADGKQCRKVAVQLNEAHRLTQNQHESSFFSTIVSIHAITAFESHILNLVAVTSKGVRLYFSCLPVPLAYQLQNYASRALGSGLTQAECRPTVLRLVHVRFSPGVCPTSRFIDGPRGVYTSLVDECLFHLVFDVGTVGATVMAPLDRQIVYALSNSFFPVSPVFRESLMELQLNERTDGLASRIWTITNDDKKEWIPAIDNGLLPPLSPHPFHVWRETSRRILMLTNNGLCEFSQSCPLDTLRNVLRESSLESQEVAALIKQWGQMQVLETACALLSSSSPADASLKQKAIGLFSLTRDEPELYSDADARSPNLQWSPTNTSIADWTQLRSPLQSSTPRGADVTSSLTPAPFVSPSLDASFGRSYLHVRYSNRHEAMYMYLTRIIVPFWRSSFCYLKDNKLHAALNDESLETAARHLREFCAALDEFGLIPRTLPTSTSHQHDYEQRMRGEAVLRERASLLGLRLAVARAAEVLSLWAIAVSHQLHVIGGWLDEPSRLAIARTSLVQLLTTDRHLSIELIKALIKYFMGDEAGTADLSARLRAFCPTLYSQEDAAVTKSMEELEKAGRLPPSADQRKLVAKAVSALREAIMKVPLDAVCKKLTQLKAWEAIAELCVERANKEDVRGLALIAYRGERAVEGDRATSEARARRDTAYVPIVEALDAIENSKHADRDYVIHRKTLVDAVLRSDDELANVFVFRWLLDHNSSQTILESKSAFVEGFLRSEIARGGGHRYHDLLWRFYEKSGDFGSAARLLSRLADSESPDLSLSQRITYLSYAIVCAENSVDPSVKAALQDFRDRLDVAKIQANIEKTLSSGDANEMVAAQRLSSRLYSLQELLTQFVVPFGLAKSKLAIFHCANVYDEEKIQSVWAEILNQELETRRNPEQLAQSLLSLLIDHYKIYASSNYFPAEFIVSYVMSKSFQFKLPVDIFPALSRKINISLVQLLRVLANTYRGDPFWRRDVETQKYVASVAILLVDSFLNSHTRYSLDQRKTMVADMEASLAAFLDVRSSTNPELREMAAALEVAHQQLHILG